jgi:hypothetical protein
MAPVLPIVNWLTVYHHRSKEDNADKDVFDSELSSFNLTCETYARILRVVILQKLNKSHACTSRKTYRTATTMMQISDVDHDASTASTANRHDSPPAKFHATSKTKKILQKRSALSYYH